MTGTRHFLLWLGLAATLLVFATAVWQKERLIAGGTTVYLPLRPADPRALIQGDYMALAYAPSVYPSEAQQLVMPPRGTVILTLDQVHVGHFARDDGGGALGSAEIRMRYRIFDQTIGRPRMSYGADSYLFPQGHADDLTQARFAILRVSKGGEAILAGLADADQRPIKVTAR